MNSPFARTLRSLDAEAPRRRGLVLLAPLLAAWAGWVFLGQVSLYEVSGQARVEASTAVHPVAADSEGRVAEVRLRIGQVVQAGDVLVVLEAQPQRLALAEVQARRQGLTRRLDALRHEERE